MVREPGGVNCHWAVPAPRSVHVLARSLCLVAAAFPSVAFAYTGVLGTEPAVLERAGRGGAAVYSFVRYFAANDWTAMGDIDGNWSARYAPRGGRNLGLDLLRVEAGVAFGSWRFGYVYRREAIVETNRDTLDLYYLENNNLPIPVGRPFALDFYGNAFEGEGLRVEKAFEMRPNESITLRAGLGASWLRGIRSRSGSVLGRVTASAPNTFAFDAAVVERDTKKTFPFMTPGSPEGSGYALDVALDLRWAGRNRVMLAVEDVVSRIVWDELPATDARATSNTAARDAQGFIVYRPALAGQNRRIEYIQRLDPKAFVEYSREFGPLSAGAGALVVRGVAIPRVALDYRLSDSWRVSAERDFRFGTKGLGLSYKSLSLSILSERADLGSAKAYGLAARVAVPF